MRLNRALGRWAAFAWRHWAWVLAITLALTAVSLVHTTRNLGFHTDAAELLSPELPYRQSVARYEAAFPALESNLLLVLEAPTPEQADRAATALAERLRRRPEVAREVFHAGGLAFLERHGLLFRDTAELERLTDRLVEAQPLLARLVASTSLAELFTVLAEAREREAIDTEALRPVHRALAGALAPPGEVPEPVSWRLLMAGEPAAGPHRSLVVVRPRLDYSRVDAGAEAIAGIRDAAAALALEDRFQARLGMTGSPALAHDELQTVVLGVEVAGAAALAAVALVLYLGLRSWRLVAAALLALVIGLILSAGLATVTVGHLNLISIAFAVLYIGLGIDYSVHFLMRQRELATAGAGGAEAMAATGRDLGTALSLCTLSTAIGFSAFVPTDFLGVSELGQIAAGAMCVSLLVTFTVLPALVAALRPGARRPPPAALGPRAARWWLALPRRRPAAVLAVTGALALASLAALPWLRFDYNPLNLRDPQSDSVATMNALLEDGSGPWQAVVLREGPGAAQREAAALRGLEPVAGVTSIFSFVPENQEAKLQLLSDLRLLLGPELLFSEPAPAAAAPAATLAAAERLQAALAGATSTEEQALAAALDRIVSELERSGPDERARTLARLREAVLGNFPTAIADLQASLRAGEVNLADLPGELRRRWLSEEGLYRLAVSTQADLRIPAALQAFVDAVRSVAPAAIGAPVEQLEAARAVIEAFREALVLALAGMAAVLLLTLRSFAQALLALTPALLAGLLTAGAMVLFGIPLNFANVIAIPLLLGVSVDNGVHVLHRFRRDPHGDLLRSSTGRAVLVSTLTTLCSFGNLSLSPHPGTASMGQVLTTGLLLTLACTLLALPALLAQRARQTVCERAS